MTPGRPAPVAEPPPASAPTPPPASVPAPPLGLAPATTLLRLTVPAGQPRERVDKVLARLVPGESRATLQRWLGEGRVRAGGAPLEPSDRVAGGVELEVDPGPPPLSAAAPDPTVLFAVVHEDAHLIVVDKPTGLVVHPGAGHPTGTLVNGLLGREGFRAAPADPEDDEGYLRPGVVHRIDKDTSGLLVVAKDAPTREGLKAQLAAHTVARRYLAITVGVPREGAISTLHGRDPRSRQRFSSRVREGKAAVTHVRVLERLAGDQAALVECRLETGRTHQIRVHLTEQAGTPLLADGLYGTRPRDPALAAAADALGRQALHAAELGFVHPITGEALHFTSALPADLAAALAALRAM